MYALSSSEVDSFSFRVNNLEGCEEKKAGYYRRRDIAGAVRGHGDQLLIETVSELLDGVSL